jgi:hypothetical protein
MREIRPPCVDRRRASPSAARQPDIGDISKQQELADTVGGARSARQTNSGLTAEFQATLTKCARRNVESIKFRSTS